MALNHSNFEMCRRAVTDALNDGRPAPGGTTGARVEPACLDRVLTEHKALREALADLYHATDPDRLDQALTNRLGALIPDVISSEKKQ